MKKKQVSWLDKVGDGKIDEIKIYYPSEKEYKSCYYYKKVEKYDKIIKNIINQYNEIETKKNNYKQLILLTNHHLKMIKKREEYIKLYNGYCDENSVPKRDI